MLEALLEQPLLQAQVEMQEKRYKGMQIDQRRCRSKGQDQPTIIKHSRMPLVPQRKLQQFSTDSWHIVANLVLRMRPYTPLPLLTSGVSRFENTRDALSAYRSRHMPRTCCRCSLKIKGPVEVEVQYLTRRRERTFGVMDLSRARTRGMCCGEVMERHAK